MHDSAPQTVRLDRPVDAGRDHVLGEDQATITLVEYGSYACPYCRAANDEIAKLRDRLGGQLRYVFRHRPLTGSDLARRAAVLAERADPDQFWAAHIKLMTRSETLGEDDLQAVAADLGVLDRDMPEAGAPDAAQARAEARVAEDERSAAASGVMVTPTFFVNGRRYDGPWDESSLADAALGTLGHRVGATALDFARWGPSAGVLLLIAALVALVLSNSPLGPAVEAFWEWDLGFAFGESGFAMSLRHWINDGLLTVFFLVVGLEIKREFTVGHLATRRRAALPVVAALGGMIGPVVLYLALIANPEWRHGWGVPVATDTAFAIALIAMLGRRVPLALRVFLTATAIVDDIGAILVVAAFYSGELQPVYLVAAAALVVLLALLNRAGVYRAAPYILLGVLLWIFVFAGGLHATLAGVLLAFVIPTRPPANLAALTAQADAVIKAEAERGDEALRHGPSVPALQALDRIHDRLESPADRLLRRMGGQSSYVVLPVFALANAGVALSGGVWSGHGSLLLAVIAGLAIGKPLGIFSASALAVRLGVAEKPDAYSWRQLAGAGALAGIGFTMSLFIAGQAFADPEDFAAAKIAVFAASVLAATLGVALLWGAEAARRPREDAAECDERACTPL